MTTILSSPPVGAYSYSSPVGGGARVVSKLGVSIAVIGVVKDTGVVVTLTKVSSDSLTYDATWMTSKRLVPRN